MMRKLVFAVSILVVFLASQRSSAQAPPEPEPAPAPPAAPSPEPSAAPVAEPAPKPAAPPPVAAPAAAPPPPGAVKAPAADATQTGVWVAHTPTVGAWVERPIFPEEKPPPFDPKNPGAPRLGLHGYFRAPLRMSWKARGQTKEGEAGFDHRTPWLVDDDFFRSGFVYTPVNESDYTELYFQVGNEYLTGTVGIAGSLYSDPARPIIDRQLGIAQGFLTYRYVPKLPIRTRIQVKGGAFSDRFGWLEKYDTYIFGRTHQMGEQVRVEVDAGKFTFAAVQGFGAHLEAI